MPTNFQARLYPCSFPLFYRSPQNMGKLAKQDLEPSLQAIATEDYIFRNWAKTYTCTCELMFMPVSEAEIVKVNPNVSDSNEQVVTSKQIVKLAKKHGKTIRVFGSGHSPSDLACSTDFMINIDNLDRILSVDKEKHRVTVEAGMSLHKLHQVLQENGLALSNLGSISDQSVAGVMSTATHGTGSQFGCLSTMVRAN